MVFRLSPLVLAFALTTVQALAEPWRKLSVSEIFGRDLGIPIRVEIPFGLVTRGFTGENPAFVLLVPRTDLEKAKADQQYRPAERFMSAKIRLSAEFGARELLSLTEKKMRSDYESGGERVLRFERLTNHQFSIVLYTVTVKGEPLRGLYFSHPNYPLVFNLSLVARDISSKDADAMIERVARSLALDSSVSP